MPRIFVSIKIKPIYFNAKLLNLGKHTKGHRRNRLRVNAFRFTASLYAEKPRPLFLGEPRLWLLLSFTFSLAKTTINHVSEIARGPCVTSPRS